jgi:GNAT superfamily N-acetyltransferase
MAITIRPVEPSDEASWRELWAAYNRFYDHVTPENVTGCTWTRILTRDSRVHAIVAQSSDGVIIGFANYVVHENTWSIEPACCLEDLYVVANRRASGVGRMLIDWLMGEMKARRWSRLYWVTRENNYPARTLYDKYGPHTGFLRYAIMNEGE